MNQIITSPASSITKAASKQTYYTIRFLVDRERVDGHGGGEWYVDLSPEARTSGEGVVEHPGLVTHLRDTAVFCQMLTSRLNLPMALIRRNMKLRGDLRLFLRMSTLFSVDARP